MNYLNKYSNNYLLLIKLYILFNSKNKIKFEFIKIKIKWIIKLL